MSCSEKKDNRTGIKAVKVGLDVKFASLKQRERKDEAVEGDFGRFLG